jgi:hypothetical protein
MPIGAASVAGSSGWTTCGYFGLAFSIAAYLSVAMGEAIETNRRLQP